MSWHFNFFHEGEFDHPERMSKRLIAKLDMARAYAGVPFKITSDFREEKEGDEPSAHHHGLAVDIACTDGRARYLIVVALLRAGFTRIGVYDRHVHADIATEFDGPFAPEVLWPGVSQ